MVKVVNFNDPARIIDFHTATLSSESTLTKKHTAAASQQSTLAVCLNEYLNTPNLLYLRYITVQIYSLLACLANSAAFFLALFAASFCANFFKPAFV